MSHIDQSRLNSLLDANNIGILDGGLATYLEDGLNFDLSKGPLWSARLLDEKEADVSNGKGCKGILDAHLHYLEAGAGIIGAATYQASLESFARAQYSEASAKTLMTKAVDIAGQSLEQYVSDTTGSSLAKPLISLSLGPYGGMLCNGAEYTGDYRKPFLPDSDPQHDLQPSLDEMTDFHQRRIETFLSHPSWQDVGVLALETIPRVDEALAFRMALENICAEHKRKGIPLEKKPVYLSFAFPDDKRLPWPPTTTVDADDEDNTEEEVMNWLLEIATGVRVQGQDSQWPIAGIGINCTKPYLLSKLVDRMTASLSVLNKPTSSEGGIDLEASRKQCGMDKPLLFLYPDGGLLYDAVKKVWIAPSNASIPPAVDTALSWATRLMKLARDTTSNQPNWKGVFVGGCCKSGTDEIRALCQCRASAL